MIEQLPPFFIPLFSFLFGLLMGSFGNVVSLRIQKKQKGILMGRSTCPKCGHQLSWWENLPLFSWLLLRGKCRSCKSPISWQYPVAELFFGLLFLLAAWQIGGDVPRLLLSFLTLFFLGVLLLSDLRYMELPDEASLPLLWTAIMSIILLGAVTWSGALLGALLIYGFFALLILIPSCLRGHCKKALLAVFHFPFWLLFALFGLGAWYEQRFEKKEEQEVELESWIGGGDLRLGIAMGLLLGWKLGALALFLSYTIGAIILLPFLLLKKKTGGSMVPFGPFLILGTIICLFFGTEILAWYLKLIGIS